MSVRGGRDRLAIAERIFAARIFIEETVVHLAVQIIVGVRFVAIDLADDDLALALELALVEERIARSVAHELHRDVRSSGWSS